MMSISTDDGKAQGQIYNNSRESDAPTCPNKHGDSDAVTYDERACKENPQMTNIYNMLAAAVSQIQDGKVLNADSALKRLRRKHGL